MAGAEARGGGETGALHDRQPQRQLHRRRVCAFGLGGGGGPGLEGRQHSAAEDFAYLEELAQVGQAAGGAVGFGGVKLVAHLLASDAPEDATRQLHQQAVGRDVANRAQGAHASRERLAVERVRADKLTASGGSGRGCASYAVVE